MAKKQLRVSAKLSLDAKTPETLFSHLNTQVNLKFNIFVLFSLLFKNHAYFIATT